MQGFGGLSCSNSQQCKLEDMEYVAITQLRKAPGVQSRDSSILAAWEGKPVLRVWIQCQRKAIVLVLCSFLLLFSNFCFVFLALSMF